METDAEAQATRFVGSPTLRVNGEDLFPVGQSQYALGCHVYATPEGLHSWPTQAMIMDALKVLNAS